jgi:hypothetical protein
VETGEMDSSVEYEKGRTSEQKKKKATGDFNM